MNFESAWIDFLRVIFTAAAVAVVVATATRTRPKNNRFILAKHQLCMCVALFCTFLWYFCTTTT